MGRWQTVEMNKEEILERLKFLWEKYIPAPKVDAGGKGEEKE